MKLGLMGFGLAVSLSLCDSVQAEEAPQSVPMPEEASVSSVNTIARRSKGRCGASPRFESSSS